MIRKEKIKVMHLTSIHPRYDTRIFFKECISLSKKYNIFLVVADGKGDEIKDGVQIYDVGKPTGRLNRILHVTRRVYCKAIELDADIYHAHDPELLPILSKLRRGGKKTIYDMHEDYLAQILIKKYLIRLARLAIVKIFSFYQRRVIKKLDAVIHVQDSIMNQYSSIVGPVHVLVSNYEIIDFNSQIRKCSEKIRLIYSGGLSEARGIYNLFNLALALPEKYELHIAGAFCDQKLFNNLQAHPGWKCIIFHGFLPRDKVYELYRQAHIGLILYNNAGQYHLANSVKLFEYMANEMLVIMPNFGDWIKFNAMNSNFSYCVETSDSLQIAKIIESVSEAELEKKAKIGLESVRKKYSWLSEEKKLLDLYDSLV